MKYRQYSNGREYTAQHVEVCSTGALLAYIPPGKIDLAAAVPQLLQAGFGSTGAGGLMTAASVAVSIVALLAAVVISVGMLARLPMVAGWDGLLPAWWSELHPTFSTPAKAIAAVTAALMLLGLVSLWGAGNEEAAQVAAAVSVAGFSMVYILLFGAVLFGFGGREACAGGWLKVGALTALLVSLLSLALAFVPLGDVPYPPVFALKVAGVLGTVYGCGAVLCWLETRRKKTRDAAVAKVTRGWP